MEYLKLAHGIFNVLVMCLFIRQGMLGLRIRKGRKAAAPPLPAIRQHRRIGPVAALLAWCGFLAGSGISFLHHGHLPHNQAHFLTGLALMLLVTASFLVSRKLKGPSPPWRTIHFAIGIAILLVYPLQVVLGLGVFL